MRAAVFEAPERIVVQDVPDPVCPDGGIVIKVHACGICGSDVRNYHTGLKDGIKSQIMGHEFTGTVAEVGRGVTRFRVGDPVAAAPDVSCGTCYYCRRGYVNLCDNHRMLGTHWPGGFAEYVGIESIVMQHGMIHAVPDGLSLDDAALSEPASSVIACQTDANVSMGDTVLIIGDGPIGCLQIQIARARGASRVIIAGKHRLSIVPRFSPDLIIDGASEDIAKVVREYTDGLGADVAICANRRASSQQPAVDAVRKRGKVVLFGGVSRHEPMTTLNSNTIHYNEITVMGSFSYRAHVHEEALRALADGRITAPAYITRTVDLDGITAGFEAAEAGDALKVLVKPDTR
ncbi:MAG: hypothetical protein EA426_09800 [Spirochaetaceae bacterium]|nr:MAG: hypothetical protein EA426_09800 [Spirochaetaceae bacterium]